MARAWRLLRNHVVTAGKRPPAEVTGSTDRVVSAPTRVSERLGANAYSSDKQAHLRIDDPDLCRKCVLKPCIPVCPAQVYSWEGDRIRISWENCLELGACRVGCQQIGNRALIWDYPRAGRGVIFRQG